MRQKLTAGEVLSFKINDEAARHLRLLRVAVGQLGVTNDVPSKTLIVINALAFAYHHGAAFCKGFLPDEDKEATPTEEPCRSVQATPVSGQATEASPPGGGGDIPDRVPTLRPDAEASACPRKANEGKRTRPRL